MSLLRTYSDDIQLSKSDLELIEEGPLKILFLDEFLSYDNYELTNKLQIPIYKILKIKENFYKKFCKSLSPINFSNENKFYSTGCEKLDEFLKGGLIRQSVTEIRGSYCSGKTQFCTNIVLSFLLRNQNVLYLDSNLSFCPIKFLKLLKKFKDDEEEVRKLMQKIDIYFINSYVQLISIITKIYNQQKSKEKNYDLIVIDSLISSLRNEQLAMKSEKNLNQLFLKIKNFVNLINMLLHENKNLVILTTYSVGIKLPIFWQNRCNTILKIKNPKRENTFFLKTIKNSFIEDKKEKFIEKFSQNYKEIENYEEFELKNTEKSNYNDVEIWSQVVEENVEEEKKSEENYFVFKLNELGQLISQENSSYFI